MGELILTPECEEDDEDGGEDVDAIHGGVPGDPAVPPGDLDGAVVAASATPQALRWEVNQEKGAAQYTVVIDNFWLSI